MGRSAKCLICYSTLRSEEDNQKFRNENEDNSCFGNTGLLADEVLIIFVVRRLLDIPNSVCDRFLKDLGSPSEWRLTFCMPCKGQLNDAKEVAKLIYNLEGKLEGLKNKIKLKIQGSYTNSGEPSRQNFHKHLEALDEIRYCVSKGKDKDEFEDEDYQDLQDYTCNLNQDSKYEDGEKLYNSKKKGKRKTGQQIEPKTMSHSKLNYDPVTLKTHKEVEPEFFENEHPNENPLIFQDMENIDIKNESLINGSLPEDDRPEEFSVHEKKSCTVEISQDLLEEAEEEKLLRVIAATKLIPGRHDNGKRRRLKGRKLDAEKPFKCTYEKCTWRYPSNFLLQSHINKIHLGVKQCYTCEICQKSFTRRDRLERHLLQGHAKKTNFKCSYSACNGGFRSQLHLDVHIQKAHLGNDNPLTCQGCEKKFDKLCSLERHMREVHEMKVNYDGFLLGRKRKEDEQSMLRPFKCPKCKMRFTDEDARYSHLQRKHNGVAYPYQCTLCAKKFIRKGMLDTHLLGHEKKDNKPSQYICPVVNCGKIEKKAYRLKDHIRLVHEDRRDFICEICSKSYKSKRSLVQHQLTLHPEAVDTTKAFSCDQCDKTYAIPSDLKNHVDGVHNNKYQFKCSHCQKGFHDESTKVVHERIHTGEKPHQCEVCGRAFAQKTRLTIHNRIHTGEKPYHCNVCGQNFAERTWFKRHQETHSGIIHKCDICGKGFPIKHNLGIHMKSHANPNGINSKRLMNPNPVNILGL